MKRVDLHTHTTCSDGTVSPTELVRLARNAGLAALAVTDHDTTEGLPEAHEAAEEYGLELIPGCEVSTNLDGQSVHVLGHGFEEGHAALEDLLCVVREDREVRNERLQERLADLGMPLSRAEVEEHATSRIVARPHFARAMVKRGYVPDTRAAFQRYLRDGGPAYVVVARPRPADAVRAIVAAGGVATLAHPRQIGLEGDTVATLLEELVEAGLAGIEVDHPSQKSEHRSVVRELARRFHLVPTGGSDFHGAAKAHIEVGRGDGTISIPYTTWVHLRDRRRPPERS